MRKWGTYWKLVVSKQGLELEDEEGGICGRLSKIKDIQRSLMKFN